MTWVILVRQTNHPVVLALSAGTASVHVQKGSVNAMAVVRICPAILTTVVSVGMPVQMGKSVLITYVVPARTGRLPVRVCASIRNMIALTVVRAATLAQGGRLAREANVSARTTRYCVMGTVLMSRLIRPTVARAARSVQRAMCVLRGSVCLPVQAVKPTVTAVVWICRTIMPTVVDVVMLVQAGKPAPMGSANVRLVRQLAAICASTPRLIQVIVVAAVVLVQAGKSVPIASAHLNARAIRLYAAIRAWIFQLT